MQPICTYAVKTVSIIVLLAAARTLVRAQGDAPVKSEVFGRRYKPGQTSHYRLTTEEIQNGQWASTTIVECELNVGYDSAGIPFEEVHWLSKKKLTAKDTTLDKDDALAVKPYHISLDPRGRLDIPKIDVPAMTGAIEDFNTFFVAVSPLLGATRLKIEGDIYDVKIPIKADFANGSTILKGDDCFAVSIKMTGKTKKEVMLHTAFVPTPQACFGYILTEMNTPVVKDTVNNFQMVSPLSNDKYNVQYGREMFYINSTVRRRDGRIIGATMRNTLTLHLKVFCDKNYSNCQADVPFTEVRNLKLELL